MKIQRVLVVKGRSRYGQLRYEADEIVHGFCDRGCLVTVVDHLTNAHYAFSTGQPTNWINEYDLILTFNAIAVDFYTVGVLRDNQVLWSFHVDPPYHHNSRLKLVGSNTVASFIDRRHVQYADRYYPNIPWVCFMPHGGIIGNVTVVPYDERRYNVVFLGSLADMLEMEMSLNEHREVFGELSDLMMERAVGCLETEFDELVRQVILEKGLNVDDDLFREIMEGSTCLDMYRRRVKRIKLVETVCAAGIPIDIWGNGWEKIARELGGVVRLHENVEYDCIKDVMSNARIVLNDMPLFHDGSHERVYAAMQCGALCVTDGSLYLEECFRHMEDIVFYDMSHLDDLPEVLRNLISNPDVSREIARKGREAAVAETWRNRAGEILDIASELM